jgi:NADP-dependent 3-hydroxy acid dehydrogenase YdfG
VAVVTGATRGIGAAIARALGSTHRLVVGGRDKAALDALVTELPDAVPWQADLADLGSVPDHLPRLDALIHNAGTITTGTLAELGISSWRQTFEVNVFAAVHMTQLLLPALRAARGHVVLINSTAGLNARAARGSYAASKYALRAFADSLRAEEAPHGLRVTSLFLGRVDTGMQRQICEAEGIVYRPEQYLSVEQVATAVAIALAAPADACPAEIVFRPGSTTEEMPRPAS